MGGDEGTESGGTLSKVVVGVLIALLAGGSAPWWWAKLFPGPAPTPPATVTAGVGACASGNSPVNEFHDAPAPNGSWDWNCDGNVERAWGACENLSRAQCEPNTNVTGAAPGFCTEIRAPSGCRPTVAECGQSGWIYPCFYNPADGRCHAGGYETAIVMKCR